MAPVDKPLVDIISASAPLNLQDRYWYCYWEHNQMGIPADADEEVVGMRSAEHQVPRIAGAEHRVPCITDLECQVPTSEILTATLFETLLASADVSSAFVLKI